MVYRSHLDLPISFCNWPQILDSLNYKDWKELILNPSYKMSTFREKYRVDQFRKKFHFQ